MADAARVNTTVAPPTLLAGKSIQGPISARMTLDSKPYINFFGWGYFALSSMPEIRAAVAHALQQGATFAQQIPAAAGTLDPIFEAVEREAASACGAEASVYFSSGYLIGMIGLASLAGCFDLIAIDESAHYSLADAAKLAGVPVHVFAHCDVDSLRTVLKKNVGAGQRPLVVTDGAFSVTGRLPPLRDYAAELLTYEGRMFVDEAHSFGVVGDHGRGAVEFFGVESIATAGATLSKAFCAQGAILGCSASTALRLRTTPQVRGATAGSPLSAVAATASLRYIASHPQIRDDLRAMATYLRDRLRSIGFDVVDSSAPIVSFKAGDHATMRAIQRRLFERGIYVVHATDYVGCGPDGSLRCALYRDHTRDDIDALIAELK